jgi:hypothetical protein
MLKLIQRRIIRIQLLSLATLVLALMPSAQAQKCFQIRGRAIWYRGDGFFAIWHVGTHHVFAPADKQSVDLVCEYFDCTSGDKEPALFADFTVCPIEPFVNGAAQAVIVKKVQHPHVVADWLSPHK